MKIFVDIDETICNHKITHGARDYSGAIPIMENIEAINKLYDEGHEITYWTARGSGTGLDWSSTTLQQFEEWGVKYHKLKFAKPIYDLFICDKAINSNVFFKKENTSECLPIL